MPDPYFSIHGDPATAAPVLLSVPHAGRTYARHAHDLRVPFHAVLPLEDRYADRLVDDAVAEGTTTIIAHAPRLAIDLNRAPGDLDPDMVRGRFGTGAPMSIKARGGLGLIPARLPGIGPLWRKPFEQDDIDLRLRDIHDPYHAAITRLLGAMHGVWGTALLIDVHSMPPLSQTDSPDIVIGDRFGQTASAAVTEAAVACFTGLGFRVACNVPYAGGHIVERHGHPHRNIHAIQVEIDRTLYLDAMLDQPGPGLVRLQRAFVRLVAMMTSELTGRYAAAAE